MCNHAVLIPIMMEVIVDRGKNVFDSALLV